MVFYQRVGRETFFEIEEDPTAPSGSIERLVDWFRKALVVPDDLPPLPPQELEESEEDIPPTEPVKMIHTPVVAGPTSGPTATQIEMGLDLAKILRPGAGRARLEIARTLEKLARQVSPQSVGVFLFSTAEGSSLDPDLRGLGLVSRRPPADLQTVRLLARQEREGNTYFTDAMNAARKWEPSSRNGWTVGHSKVLSRPCHRSSGCRPSLEPGTRRNRFSWPRMLVIALES